MNTSVQRFLKSFDRLSEKERAEIASAIIQRTIRLDLPFLSDNDFVLMAEELFLKLDYEEAHHA